MKKKFYLIFILALAKLSYGFYEIGKFNSTKEWKFFLENFCPKKIPKKMF